ncbi:MAG: DUF2779 domain-containing protein [Myxococcales bacterium]|nr:DUF2779 domain-containing protein [Myxococcales bacterium]
MTRRYGLSKSKFVAGVQCHRMLWWRVHEPDAPELAVDDGLQRVFDTGHAVGVAAQRFFGEGKLIELDLRDVPRAIDETRAAIEAGETTIFEAAFSEDGVFAAVDILSKDGDSWVITEVKSTTRVKDQFIPDVALQAHVVESAGLSVVRAEVMHLNSAHRHPDNGPLFIRSDVTETITDWRSQVPQETEVQRNMLAGPLPTVEPGPHCKKPYECDFFGRCNKKPPVHSVAELYRITDKGVAKWHQKGIELIADIPAGAKLNAIHDRQRRALQTSQPIVEDGLAQALDKYRFPIAMFDYETVTMALPIWNGTGPFEQIPVQYSIHLLGEDGSVEHREYLADGGGDPREGLARSLVKDLGEAGSIVAWSAVFELQRTGALAEYAREALGDESLAGELNRIAGAIEDLLPVVRDHLYHPAFHGSFSLKSVVPALLPELSYDDLDVGDGGTAAGLLADLLLRPETIEDAAKVRGDLLAYCRRDTEVMVEIFRVLRGMAEEA